MNKLRTKLNQQENDLTDYNVQNSVINYTEQTKSIANSFADFENRYEETQRSYESSTKIINELEKYMEVRTKLVKTNEEFINALEDVSRISGKITEIETFTSENALNKDTELTRYQDQLKDVEKRIALLTDKINSYKESKEGVAIDGLVQEWLSQTLIQVKSKADLEILKQKESTISRSSIRIILPLGLRSTSKNERSMSLNSLIYKFSMP